MFIADILSNPRRMNVSTPQRLAHSSSSFPNVYDDCGSLQEQNGHPQRAEHSLSKYELPIPRFLGDGFHWVQEVYRNNFPGSPIGSEQDIDREALKIWKLFFTCEAYQKYRKGPAETARKRKGQVWPDHLEGAFMKGNPRMMEAWSCPIDS
jgi:hypothetical protein